MICIGSSCHLKGSHDIVQLFEKAIKDNLLEDEVVLSGSFCLGECSRIGVTVHINDNIYPGVTREDFDAFFKTNVLSLSSK